MFWLTLFTEQVFPESPLSKVQSIGEGGPVVVVVGGFGVVVGMMSTQDLSLMMWMSSSARLSSSDVELACKIICNEAEIEKK